MRRGFFIASCLSIVVVFSACEAEPVLKVFDQSQEIETEEQEKEACVIWQVIEERAYDGQDKLLSRTTYEYDEEGRPVREMTYSQEDLVRELRNTYDEEGHILTQEEIGPEGQTVRREESVYDEWGNRTYYKVTEEKGKVTEFSNEYTYDEQGHMLTCAYYYNGTKNGTEVYTYDAQGRLIRMEDGDHLFEYEYEDDLLAQIYEKDGLGWYTTFSYDEEGRLVLQERLFALDRSLVEALQYTYDADGRLIREETLDEEGASKGSIGYDHDENGNQIRKTVYDETGSIVSYETKEYEPIQDKAD